MLKFNHMKNQQGGFLQLIIFIVVVVFLMHYFGLTLTGIFNWFAGMFHSII